jgi:hypothetical protein
MKKVKQSRKGSKTYNYWMASWREGGKTRNVHLGSARKMDGNDLNNRRYNLRLVDHRRNTRNSHSRQHITKASQEHKQLCLMLFS